MLRRSSGGIRRRSYERSHACSHATIDAPYAGARASMSSIWSLALGSSSAAPPDAAAAIPRYTSAIAAARDRRCDRRRKRTGRPAICTSGATTYANSPARIKTRTRDASLCSAHAPATTAPTTATTCRTPRVWRVSAVRCPERATGSRRAVSGHCSSRRGARSRRTSSCTVGFRLRRVAFHLVCAVRDCVGDIVTRVAAATSAIVDGVDDSRARLLIVLRGPLPETHRRMGGSLAKLCGRARREPQRQAGADERASQQAEDEAGAAAIARKLVHESGTPLSAG